MEGNGKNFVRKILIILQVEDDPMTYKEGINNFKGLILFRRKYYSVMVHKTPTSLD